MQRNWENKIDKDSETREGGELEEKRVGLCGRERVKDRGGMDVL